MTEKLVLMGAGGKMGVRSAANLARADFDVAHVEISEAGRARLKETVGVDCVNIPDGPRASARMSSLSLAILSAREVGIEPIQIHPKPPWENGYNERFNGTLRHEILNAGWFHTPKRA